MNAESIGRIASHAAKRVRGWRQSLERSPRTPRTRPARLQVGGPILGNVFALARDRLWVMQQAGAIRGGICELPLARGSVVVVSTPDLVHEVLVTQADSFAKGTTFRFLRPVIGNGLLTSEGDFHKRQRKLMAPALAHKRIAAYADTMAAYAERAQAGWEDGAHIDLSAEMMRLTLDIVSKTLLDTDVGTAADEVGSAVSVLMRDVNARISTPMSFLLGSVSRELGGARGDGDPRPRHLADHPGATREQGGHRRPSVDAPRCAGGGHRRGHERRAGARRGDDDLPRRPRDHGQRSFVGAVPAGATPGRPIDGSATKPPRSSGAARRARTTSLGWATPSRSSRRRCRLYPPAYLTSRLAVRDVEIGGHLIRAGTDVIANICAMQRRPEYFPDPDRFDPDRFEAAAEKNLPRGAYLPFGAGARICIGNNFAMMEGQLILATLAQRVDLSLDVAGDIAPEPLVTLRPAGGVPMRVRRLPSARAIP